MPVMTDDINAGALGPADAHGAYVDDWPQGTVAAVAADFPGVPILTIATHAQYNADCLDVERGDATPAQAPEWFRRQLTRGLAKPWLYASASTAGALNGAMAAAGIPRSAYFLWSAHYQAQHVCGPHSCGYPAADGTQWAADTPHGDISEISEAFLAALIPKQPIPVPQEDDDMPTSMYGQVPTNGTPVVIAIPPPNGGGANWGPAWFSMGCDFANATVRVAVHNGTSWRLIQSITLTPAGGRVGFALQAGDDKISLGMQPPLPGGTTGWLIEYGAAVAA